MLALEKLEAMAGRMTRQLSGRQQQRVAPAWVLAPQPKVLLLDEPLSAPDLKLRKEMQIELKRLYLTTVLTGKAEDGTLRLANKERITVPGLPVNGTATVGIRPEQQRLGEISAPLQIVCTETAAMISNFARHANGIAGSKAFMDAEMTAAPDVAFPKTPCKRCGPADLHRQVPGLHHRDLGQAAEISNRPNPSGGSHPPSGILEQR